MQADIGNFVAQIFLGSLFNLAVNMLFFWLGIYLAAQMLGVRGNSLNKAFTVAIIVFIVSFIPRLFFFVDQFFSLLILFVALIAVIKAVYKCDWPAALLTLIIATAIAALGSIAISPIAAYTIFR